jgi:hypothetical protein
MQIVFKIGENQRGISVISVPYSNAGVRARTLIPLIIADEARMD